MARSDDAGEAQISHSPPPLPDRYEERPPARRAADYEDDYDDLDYRPRRRRRNTYGREEALGRVRGPGILLQVSGIILAGAGALCIIGTIAAVALLSTDNINRADEEGMIALAVICGIGFLFGVPVGVILTVGGSKLKSLRSYGWAMTATILVFVIGLLACIPLMLVGIWPLVVLLDSNVKEAFGESGFRE